MFICLIMNNDVSDWHSFFQYKCMTSYPNISVSLLISICCNTVHFSILCLSSHCIYFSSHDIHGVVLNLAIFLCNWGVQVYADAQYCSFIYFVLLWQRNKESLYICEITALMVIFVKFLFSTIVSSYYRKKILG